MIVVIYLGTKVQILFETTIVFYLKKTAPRIFSGFNHTLSNLYISFSKTEITEITGICNGISISVISVISVFRVPS